MIKPLAIILSLSFGAAAQSACVDLTGTYLCGQTYWTFTPQACAELTWEVRAQNPNGDYENHRADYLTDGVRRKIGEKTLNGERRVSYLTLAYQGNILRWDFDTETTKTCLNCDPAPSVAHDTDTFALNERRDLIVRTQSSSGPSEDLVCSRTDGAGR